MLKRGADALSALRLLPLLLAIDGADHFISAPYRRLFIGGPGTQFLEDARFFKFLLKTLQRLIDRLILFYVNYDHNPRLLLRGANIAFWGKIPNLVTGFLDVEFR